MGHHIGYHFPLPHKGRRILLMVVSAVDKFFGSFYVRVIADTIKNLLQILRLLHCVIRNKLTWRSSDTVHAVAERDRRHFNLAVTFIDFFRILHVEGISYKWPSLLNFSMRGSDTDSTCSAYK